MQVINQAFNMKGGNIVYYLLFLLCVSGSLGQEDVDPLLDKYVMTINLTNYDADHAFKERYTFEPSNYTTINITHVPPMVSFMILQIHTYQYNITLSYDEENLEKISNKSIFGSNIGLFIDNMNDTFQMFTKNDNVEKVEALMVITLYENKAPIPGGCNMEFDIKYAPYQKLTLGNAMITVDFQPSSMPSATGNQSNCDKNTLQYDVYQMYLSEQDFSIESYFQGISSMISVQDIMLNGNKIPESTSFSPMRRIYGSYLGTGSVYAVVVSYGNYSAAYVPTFTYSCSPVLNPDSCAYLTGALQKTVCALNLIVGLISIFIGHRCFRIELCLHLYLIGSLIGYTISVAAANYETPTNIGIGMATGIMMVLFVWLSICCCASAKSYRSLITTITLGPFIGCIIYFICADFPGTLENDWVFYILVIAIMILVFLAVGISPYFVGTTAAGICSSYSVIVSIDYYTGTSLKYIIINMIRRLIVPGFNLAVIYPPRGGTETTLIVFWVLLCVFRVVRYYRYLAQKTSRRDYVEF